MLDRIVVQERARVMVFKQGRLDRLLLPVASIISGTVFREQEYAVLYISAIECAIPYADALIKQHPDIVRCFFVADGGSAGGDSPG